MEIQNKKDICRKIKKEVRVIAREKDRDREKWIKGERERGRQTDRQRQRERDRERGEKKGEKGGGGEAEFHI